MKCPICGGADTVVKDSRTMDHQTSIRRRRVCEACGFRFTTFETPQLKEIWVVKRDGREEPFDRNKLIKSIKTAILKRCISADEIEKMLVRIVSELEFLPDAKVSSQKLGEMVLKELQQMDPVAYVRFASIYEKFQDVQDFIELIKTFEDKNKNDINM